MRPALLALALLGCASPQPRVGPWSVAGTASSADAFQALAIVDAAKRVMPESPLEQGGTIRLMPAINSLCYPGMTTPMVITGCVAQGGVYVLWPHPRCPGCDLTGSALAHELCHWGQGYQTTEATADACALLVNLEYRKAGP